ncbi:MAG: SDR family NAD(P)-dependent oxidoreductase [Thermodesulfobacteriota bacterium]
MITKVLQEVDPAKWQEHLYGLPPGRWASLRGKSFWVTGAGTGYGRALACALAAAGCQVFLTGRRQDKLLETIKEISALQIDPSHCQIIAADLTNPEEINRACDRVKELCQGLHGLINNAAIPGRPGSLHPLQEDPLEYWQKMVAINVTAPWLITREIFPHLLASGQVRVLFITSGAGWAATPGYGLYNVSKAALNSLAHSLAQEYASSYREADIQINALDPGEARTEMNQGSNQSPYAVASMALLLLSQPPGGPNGRFFHRDGRHLEFGDTAPYRLPLTEARREEAKDFADLVDSWDNRAGMQLPTLVKEGYLGYNIVLCNSVYYAISQNIGRIDLHLLNLAEYQRLRENKHLLVAPSRRGINNEIRKEALRRNKAKLNLLVSRLLTSLPSSLQFKLHRVIHRLDSSFYPVIIPGIDFRPHQDLILLELPPRYMPMMPNGVGYVHNILKGTGIQFQTLDLNIICYHRFHARRIQGNQEEITLPSGYVVPKDPWDLVNTEKWSEPEMIAYFRPQIEEIVKALIEAKPKIIGLSLNGLNLKVAAEVVKGVRAGLPEVIILVGGHSCVYPTVGPWLFPHFDYMVIGEAELTLEPLLKELLAGKRPRDLPGIISRYDTPGRVWDPGPLLEDLDSLDFPRYDWTNLNVYRSYDGYQLTPIAASRGCRWSKCNFCGECFRWRGRSPKKVADEIEWLAHRGCYLFHFNESDANGDPQALMEICDEIIRRRLKVSLVGQLRIDKRSNWEFFQKLRQGGFVSLRFGVDGWSSHTLRLQRKGYTMAMVKQNLRDCYEAGISVAVNVLIGVPGETEEDIQETIENLLRCKNHIHLVEGINSLLLVHGSEYYNHPEKHNIHFRGNKEEIYQQHRNAIPPELWYSTGPYIDHEIRVQRLKTIHAALIENGMITSPYVEFTVDKRKSEVECLAPG